MSTACRCNGWWGRLLYKRPWRDLTKKGGAVETELAAKPWQYSGTRSLEKHLIVVLTGIRLNSALKFTVPAMSEGQFAPHDMCWCLLGTIIIVLHSFLAQHIEILILYIFNFLVEIPLWQSQMHCKWNNDVFSILWHQLGVLFPLLGVGSRIGWLHSWDNQRTT